MLLLLVLGVTACSVNVQPLMPTPLIYTVNDVGPLDHIPDEEHWNLRRIYYATTRQRNNNMQKIDYTNKESHEVSVLSLIHI